MAALICDGTAAANHGAKSPHALVRTAVPRAATQEPTRHPQHLFNPSTPVCFFEQTLDTDELVP
ncbi:hypothetical protein SNOG_06809 [Parastagonospora nodorum SN15]|uniref:Uncharacterized protein n=1 Tax=Phaeosphaeria nodorum (strain SN15 / ATCC MYA-4574 / FGSC 10173) TaxID=321614 RepID=Q0UN55_PHANO|nr:hypothetical protein SNOG_06809 [Parastagonospora nodorum SN15]EAT85460.1 hypothetical protein SNOG_06809 [Parastagonospora nodorum SN15]